jgi:hypothetical protein
LRQYVGAASGPSWILVKPRTCGRVGQHAGGGLASIGWNKSEKEPRIWRLRALYGITIAHSEREDTFPGLGETGPWVSEGTWEILSGQHGSYTLRSRTRKKPEWAGRRLVADYYDSVLLALSNTPSF